MSTNDHWIAAGVDGSPDAERALQWAAGEAKLRNAAMRIVTAWQVPVIAYTPHGASPPAGASLEDRIREAAEGVAEAAAQRVREEADLAVETRVIEGKPADVLIEQSRGARSTVLHPCDANQTAQLVAAMAGRRRAAAYRRRDPRAHHRGRGPLAGGRTR